MTQLALNELLEGYELMTRHLIMYPDLSVTGRLFGGKVLSWLDESLAMFAFKHMRSRDVVTRHISEVNFETPGLLGDLLEIYARPQKEGRTSLAVEGLVVARRVQDGGESLHLINSCEIVFVAIDEKGKPFVWNKA